MKKINIYFGKKYYIGKELHGLTEAHSFFDEKRAFVKKKNALNHELEHNGKEEN